MNILKYIQNFVDNMAYTYNYRRKHALIGLTP